MGKVFAELLIIKKNRYEKDLQVYCSFVVFVFI
jgi:hypothetical protein